VLEGCSSRPKVHSCADDLNGVWGGWAFIDDHDHHTVEAFPMFPDGAGDAHLIGAPRVIDLQRTASGLDGGVRRRFEQRGAVCESYVPVHIGTCGDALEVTIADPPQPAEFQPCRWAVTPTPRTEHWRAGEADHIR
jgi:hypothetical protein